MPRFVLTGLAAMALAVTGLITTTVPATAATADIRINEVESNGDAVGDFTELYNPTAQAVDLSGLAFRDNDATHAFYRIPAGTTIAAGGYYVITEAEQSFGLGEPDSVTLYQSDTTTVIDTYSWTTHATTTYGRCPNGTGPFTTTAASTRGATNSCPPPTSPVKINEIESDDGAAPDWVELVNTGTAATDVSGYQVRDSGDAPYTIPAGTTVAPGGYLVIDTLGFGLSGGDAVRLYLPGAAVGAPYDSYSWTAHATTTYGRCPNGTGAFATTASPTKGGANSCTGDIVAGPWPGAQSVSTVDSASLASQVISNLSGLAYEGSGSVDPGTLWAVRNGPGTLYKLQKSGATWTQAPGDWAAGKALRYTAAGTATTEDPDAEGVTLTDAGSAGGVFVSTERNNAVSGTSRPAIQRFDVATSGTTLVAARDWNLTADLPALGANLGLEGIAWVPDSYLVGSGFRDQKTGTAYNPATYANHGTGLFFVGVEQNGMVYAYALDQTSNSYTRVASFASGFPAVMELSWEPESQKLWVVCDDTCQGRSSRFAVNGSGFFAPTPYVERPTGMPNLNNEGFTTTPRSECVGGLKPALWADDGDTNGFSLRQGTVTCTPLPSTTTSSPGATTGSAGSAGSTGSTGSTAVVGDKTAPTVHVKGVKRGALYPGKRPSARCAADVSAVRCTIATRRKPLNRGLLLLTKVARATDAAGNTATARKSYVVRR